MMRDIQEMICDDRGLSAVIAVILLVGVTMILGTIIGAFVMGVGDGFTDSSPNTAVNFDYNESSNDITITHADGKLLMQDNTGIMRVSGSATDSANGEEWSSSFENSDDHDPTEAQVIQTVGVSDEIWSTTNEGAAATISSGENIQLIWLSPDGSESDVIGQFEAP